MAGPPSAPPAPNTPAGGARVEHRVGPETARLRLRAFEPSDAEVFQQLTSHPAVIRYTGDGPIESLATCRHLIATYPDYRLHGFGRWASVLKASGEVVGMTGLKYLPEWQVVDLGYRYLPAYWGRGFATEASRACLAFAFNTLALNEVHAFADPANTASRHVMDKLGMRHTEDVLYDGQPTVRYVITAAQWAQWKAHQRPAFRRGAEGPPVVAGQAAQKKRTPR